jgi:hypothetical protein
MFGMDNNEMAMASSLLLGCAAQALLLALLVRQRSRCRELDRQLAQARAGIEALRRQALHDGLTGPQSLPAGGPHRPIHRQGPS